MTKTIHFHRENRFVLQQYGAVRKLYQTKHVIKKFRAFVRNAQTLSYSVKLLCETKLNTSLSAS